MQRLRAAPREHRRHDPDLVLQHVVVERLAERRGRGGMQACVAVDVEPAAAGGAQVLERVKVHAHALEARPQASEPPRYHWRASNTVFP